MKLGSLVGRGRTSDVYALGEDSVVKVPHASVPEEWANFEARLTAAVHGKGVPAPAVHDVLQVNGRPAVVFERIDGPSMWQQMTADPSGASAMARDLAAIQRSLLAIGMPEGLPDFVDRLVRKIRVAPGLGDTERAEAINLTSTLPRGAALLHGDMHPGNVLMGEHGPVVIDWFDATIGHPVADIVRTSILMRPGPAGEPRHLPGASPPLLKEIRRAYLSAFTEELSAQEADLPSWQAVVAAGRLAEGAELDEGPLVQLWNARSDSTAASELLLTQ